MKNENQMNQKTFLPELEAVRKIQDYVSGCLPADYQRPEKLGQIELIVEEVVINIVNHAFSDVENGFIKVGVEGKASLEIEIRDNGRPFNPLEMADPDVDAPLDEREPGGLGIFFVRQLSAEVTYLREAENNVLRLVL